MCRAPALHERDLDVLTGADPLRDGVSEGGALELDRFEAPIARVPGSASGGVAFKACLQLIASRGVFSVPPLQMWQSTYLGERTSSYAERRTRSFASAAETLCRLIARGSHARPRSVALFASNVSTSR